MPRGGRRSRSTSRSLKTSAATVRESNAPGLHDKSASGPAEW